MPWGFLGRKKNEKGEEQLSKRRTGRGFYRKHRGISLIDTSRRRTRLSEGQSATEIDWIPEAEVNVSLKDIEIPFEEKKRVEGETEFILINEPTSPYFRIYKIVLPYIVTTKDHPLYKERRGFRGPELIVKVTGRYCINIGDLSGVRQKHAERFRVCNDMWTVSRYLILIENQSRESENQTVSFIIGKEDIMRQLREMSYRDIELIEEFLES